MATERSAPLIPFRRLPVATEAAARFRGAGRDKGETRVCAVCAVLPLVARTGIAGICPTRRSDAYRFALTASSHLGLWDA